MAFSASLMTELSSQFGTFEKLTAKMLRLVRTIVLGGVKPTVKLTRIEPDTDIGLT